MASPGTCPPLAGRHILLGITGSIAAYKAAVLCRLLKTAGADVRVVMTPLAKQFITPLTMATLSKNPILVEFFDPENGAWNSHVSLGEWADCYLIAPATANTLASTYALLAESYGATPIGVDDLNQTIELLLAGRVDATLNAEVSLYDFLKVHPDANIKMAALSEDASLVSIPVRKGEDSATFLAAVNEAIEQLHAEGVISELSIKYFGSDITRAAE